MLSQKINEILKLSQVSPIIVCELSSKIFENAVVLEANISSSQLGIVNTKNGLKYPDWFLNLKDKTKDTLIINLIDSIPTEEQEKFYEILKYREITNTALPEDIKIILTAKNIKNVSQSILRLCMIY